MDVVKEKVAHEQGKFFVEFQSRRNTLKHEGAANESNGDKMRGGGEKRTKFVMKPLLEVH